MTDTNPADPNPAARSIPWLPLIVVVGVTAMAALYWDQTRLPSEITIAGGPLEGRYAQLALGLATELDHRFDINVIVTETHGSMENFESVQSGQAMFGLYQAETRAALEHEEDPTSTVRFVANMYPEYLIPVTAADANVDLMELTDRIVACNDLKSGDHTMMNLLLGHLGGSHRPVTATIEYIDMPSALDEGKIDLAIIGSGLDAPVLAHLLENGKAKLARIPFLDSFVAKNPAFTQRTIPAGFFARRLGPVPDEDFATVTIPALLLASTDAPVRLVEAVTEILLDPGFQRRMDLLDLNAGGRDFAMTRPEFPMHPGASHVYHPDLKPLLNPDFVEGTEGIRSFLVSILAAMWLARRWWHRRQTLSQEHRLDRYIRDLLQIERDQIGVDGVKPDDAEPLQRLLDRVTDLRQAALAEFTAHEMNEDQAVDCFVQMCHALSDKISGKLTRHALRQFNTQ